MRASTAEAWYIGLFLVTVVVVLVDVLFLWKGALLGVLLHRDWLSYDYPTSLGDRITSNVAVSSPIVGAFISVAQACYWPFVRRRARLRYFLIWMVALTLAICGLPVACACMVLEGIRSTGFLAH
jgi:ABC-type uncharacterized transport system permease subunit